MKLRNKKTGGIVIKHITITVDNEYQKTYSSLAELNEDWEDYKEPKKHWTLDGYGYPMIMKDGEFGTNTERDKEIGNYFETKEEAEKAVEKLKAWKRLKDKGFEFKGINTDTGNIKTGLSKGVSLDECEEFYEDMKLLFGGEV